MTASKCFITERHKFCLIDSDGCIRATAYDLDEIYANRLERGWGLIFRIEFDIKKRTLTIGEEIK